MRKLRSRDVRHVCSVPHCKNIHTKLVSRSDDFTSGQRVYICSECAAGIAALFMPEPAESVPETVPDAPETVQETPEPPKTPAKRKPKAGGAD